MTPYTGQRGYVPSGSQPGTQTPTMGQDVYSHTKCPHSTCQGQELGQGPWQGRGNADVVDKGLNKGRVGSSYREGQRVRVEQLGTEAAPGQSKPEEGGGPSWVQRAGGGGREERTQREPEGRLAAAGRSEGPPEVRVMWGGVNKSPPSTSPG